MSGACRAFFFFFFVFLLWSKVSTEGNSSRSDIGCLLPSKPNASCVLDHGFVKLLGDNGRIDVRGFTLQLMYSAT